MKFSIARIRAASVGSSDRGVSLVEILVAIVIVSIIATASASLIISGITAAAAQERRQVAVTIASGRIESVTANGPSRAVTGRAALDVSAAWLANASKSGVSKTIQKSDTLVTSSSGAVNPITSVDNLSGTRYTTTVLIGDCYQPKAGGDCVVATAGPSVSKLLRVIVIVRWTPGKGCPANECFYQTTTLLDPNGDIDWVTSG